MADGAEFYFAAMSPYAWFAAERIEELLPAARWMPVTAAFLFKAAEREPWGLTDAREKGIAACEERAAARGLGPIRWPEPWPTSDVDVGRAMVYADERALLKPYALTAMRMCFLEGRVLSEPQTLADAGEAVGIAGDELLAAVASPEIKQRLREQTDAASARGVIGVPTVAVGEELFWGDDRLEQAAAAARASAVTAAHRRSGS